VLLRNTDVFERWRRLGLNYMFLGMEALDEAGLDLFRKRVSPDENFQALEVARKIGLTVAINLIVSPDWDTKQFALVRKWALSVPEIVNLTVMTPYPGTEIWHTEALKLTSLDYRLFDIQHAVLPTKLPLDVFYQELVKTQSVLNRKHLGVAAVAQTFGIIGRNLMHGQTNFARMLWKFNKVYNAPRQYGDHLASRLIAGWATAAPPSAERKNRTCSISSLVISVANALIFGSLKETWRPPVTPPWVPVPPRMLVEWTYRYLAAAHVWADTEAAAINRLTPPVPAQGEPSTAAVRAWARTTGLTVPNRGRLRPDIWAARRGAHQE